MTPLLKGKIWSIVVGAAVAAIGAGLAYAVQAVSALAGAGDLGPYGPTLAALLAIAANTVRKLLERPPIESGPPDDECRCRILPFRQQ